jgi:uncharacterized membrane protein YdjX (TVP38/TMEM64 family)
VVLSIILSKLLIENVLGISMAALCERWVTHAGTRSGTAIVILLAADLFLPIPSSIIMVLSGAAFGVLWGSLLSFVGSVGGEWLGFELVRRYGRRASRLIVSDEEIVNLERVFERHGMAVVAATRALPIAMETMSVVAGMSAMSRGRFLLGSLVGTAPVVFVYAYAGAESRRAQSIVPAAVILVAASACAWIWFRAKVQPPPPTGEDDTRDR